MTRAVEGLHRVARHGRQALTQVPNLACPRNRLILARGRLPLASKADDWIGGPLRQLTWSDLRPLLVKTGLKIAHLAFSGRLRELRSNWWQYLGADLLIGLRRAS